MSSAVIAPKPHGGAVVISENITVECSDQQAETIVYEWQIAIADAIESSGGLVGHIKALLFCEQQTIMISCVGDLPSISISPASSQTDLIGRLSVTIIVFGISKAAVKRYLGKLKNLLTGHK